MGPQQSQRRQESNKNKNNSGYSFRFCIYIPLSWDLEIKSLQSSENGGIMVEVFEQKQKGISYLEHLRFFNIKFSRTTELVNAAEGFPLVCLLFSMHMECISTQQSLT